MSNTVKKGRLESFPELSRTVHSVEKARKRFSIAKGSVEECLSEDMSKLTDHQSSVSKSLQNVANHVGSVEDSFIVSLKAFEFEKD